MKTMTCRQLGGPCDLPLSGDSGDEIIKAQDPHLKEIVASEDTEHQSALQDMKGRWTKYPTGAASARSGGGHRAPHQTQKRTI